MVFFSMIEYYKVIPSLGTPMSIIIPEKYCGRNVQWFFANNQGRVWENEDLKVDNRRYENTNII
jgi:hypothetical protein